MCLGLPLKTSGIPFWCACPVHRWWLNSWVASQTSCPWGHDCAGAGDGRPHRAILGKSFSRHDLVRRVCVSHVVEPGCHRGVLNEGVGASVSQGAPLMSWPVCASCGLVKGDVCFKNRAGESTARCLNHHASRSNAFRFRRQDHRILRERNANPDVKCQWWWSPPTESDTCLKEGMCPREGVGVSTQYPFQSCTV